MSNEIIDDEIEYSPISSNKIWQGRRFKTKEYSKWRFDLGLLLKKREKICGWVEIELHFYINNFGRRDLDNLLKGLLDGFIDKGYLEDDRKIVHLDIWKHKIKGRERIKFVIKKYGD